MRALRDDPRRVPLADRLEVSFGRGINPVRRAGAGEARLVVPGLDVVEQLVFGAAPVDVLVLFGSAVEDPAVARLADLPLELELEVAELVLRDDIGDGDILGERVAGDVPAGGDGLALIAAPRVE